MHHVGFIILMYFYLLNATLKVAKKGRNMSEVYNTLFTIVCNYTQVVGMRVVNFRTSRNMSNFKSQRKIFYL
jgi:hypothetical protein